MTRSDGTVLDYKIPSMILQPLVENAVNHGIRGVEWQGEIHLKVQDKGERIEIRVEDNGKGIIREQVGTSCRGAIQPWTVIPPASGGNVIARLSLLQYIRFQY
ncbi:sensor histidine kinase [Enterocloster sp.]|uniref:sensor histidine kinase n=1 Tax=Enterocloster sp. TaxID=2719315 RepID=UPI0039A1C24B